MKHFFNSGRLNREHPGKVKILFTVLFYLIGLFLLYIFTNLLILAFYPAGFFPTEIKDINITYPDHLKYSCHGFFTSIENENQLIYRCGNYWPFFDSWIVNDPEQIRRYYLHSRSFNKEKIKNRDLSYEDLNSLDYRGRDLQGFNFDGSSTNGTNFTMANLLGAKISEQQLNSAGSICMAILPDGSRGGCKDSLDLTYMDFSKKDLKEINFSPVTKNYDNKPVKMIRTLRYSDFSHSNLTNADFSNANLQHVNFKDATLTNANFDGADLSYTNFNGANVTGASFNNVGFFNSNITEAQLKSAASICNSQPPNGNMLHCPE